MRPTMIRLLILTLSATALAIPATAATGSEASSRHVRKHHKPMTWNNSVRRSWAAGEIRPVASVPAYRGGGEVCPGLARSFDCKIWPPPIEDDPDRKATSSDGN